MPCLQMQCSSAEGYASGSNADKRELNDGDYTIA
jgi:hypothetical protein